MTAPPPALLFRTELGCAQRRSGRTMALGITAAVHVLAVAVAAAVLSWHNEGLGDRQRPSPPVTFRLRATDTARDRPKAGAMARPSPSIPVPTIVEPAPLAPPRPVDSAETPTPAPIADQGGRDEAMSQEAQSWRRAIMERLEAQRLYPDAALRRAWQGSGAVRFRVERSGRLLDVELAGSTGRTALDAAARGIVARAAPFPAIPESLPDEMAITMPVQFLIASKARAVEP